ncbi:hypothetical protein EW026_g3210 [Hermanssonia centrifuga]|uniref:Uncharacterized protein n=1 Tax=Hermanssonia centrifuga TaxID=98765 RepID=A0A4S4KKU6_9APHY|nr:hypothetical protein EW026_g3210 [Hermanssonia centrifuga]
MFIGIIPILLGFLATVSQRVVAQGTNATCLVGFEWMTNSRGQSPCLIAAYLNSACISDPTDATVFYSVIGACAACQDRDNLPWSGWDSNCSTVYNSVWPTNIPTGTAIPAWAYLDVVEPDSFNITAAQALADEDLPESTAAAGPSATSGSSGSSTSSSASIFASSSAHTLTPEAANSSSGSKSNVGPIVGGVVGGIGGAAIIAAAIAFWLIKRRRASKVAPSTYYANEGQYQTSPFDPAMGQVAGAGVPYTGIPQTPTPPPIAVVSGSMPVYNPNDPSTFPTADPAPTSFTHSHYTSGGPTNSSYQPTSGGYSGAPEL